ncbi:hypothetical protein RJ640_021091 [Escallonia rubra]|uniref:Uncharacterized protein n=1 Tax=Escallonia rubra TaxID=112253 RepID=A0AA88UET4_9ASTE|nr:hypothetical protein RJ640_021091 [Escallonia rubra]
MAEFNISWIICWQYAIQKGRGNIEYPPRLVRQFGSKWWPKFNYNHCNVEAVMVFPTLKPATTQRQLSPVTRAKALKSESEFTRRKNDITVRLTEEKPYLTKKENFQEVAIELLKMEEDAFGNDSYDSEASSDKEYSRKESDEFMMDNMSNKNIKTQRYNMCPKAQNLVFIYRIYYKAMTTICPAFKQIADPGKSVILFQSNPDKTNVMLPRRIKFNEITPPRTTQIDHIIETPEGDVKIRFCQPET